jgi:hypothetical protein
MHSAHKGSPNQKDIENALTQLRGVMLYDTTAVTKPVQPIKPIQPIQSVQPIKPIQSIQSVQPEKPIQSVQQSVQPMQPQSNENGFRPALNQDPLFWCLYIMKNGAFKYDQLPNRFTAEQDGKRDEIMMLRDRAKQLKQSTGLKFSASTIECDIMAQRITLHAFHVLVHLNDLNAVFVNPHNRVYAEFISDAIKPVHVIERTNKQMTMTQATEAQLTAIRATHYRIENLQKPMKAASAYTVAELTEMCHTLKIPMNQKMKKQELYEAVAKQLCL